MNACVEPHRPSSPSFVFTQLMLIVGEHEEKRRGADGMGGGTITKNESLSRKPTKHRCTNTRRHKLASLYFYFCEDFCRHDVKLTDPQVLTLTQASQNVPTLLVEGLFWHIWHTHTRIQKQRKHLNTRQWLVSEDTASTVWLLPFM